MVGTEAAPGGVGRGGGAGRCPSSSSVVLSSKRSLTLASNTLNSLLPRARQNNLQRSRGDTPEYLGTHCRRFPSMSV